MGNTKCENLRLWGRERQQAMYIKENREPRRPLSSPPKIPVVKGDDAERENGWIGQTEVSNRIKACT